MKQLSSCWRALIPENLGSGAAPTEGDALLALKRSAALADAAPVMIWSTGPDRSCDYFNQCWLDYRGRTLEQETGDRWFEGIHPEDLAHCIHVRDGSFDQRATFQVEYRLLRHDKIYHWVFETGAPWFYPAGVFRGYIGSCVDIHGRKLLEESLREVNASLRHQNQELSEFTYAASHDLQEPLRTIANFTELLAKSYEDRKDQRQAELVTILLNSTHRMQVLIHDLLDYSHMIHQSDLKLVELDCNALLDEVLLTCQAAMNESGAIVTHDPLPNVVADEAQLGRVLQNLIINAIKYRQADERPRVHISVADRPEEWVFEIRDNGIGFEPQYAERIFGLFKRLHGQSEYTGSGLGLAICRKIIERHGGRIWAESEPGHGARFFFTLPHY